MLRCLIDRSALSISVLTWTRLAVIITTVCQRDLKTYTFHGIEPIRLIGHCHTLLFISVHTDKVTKKYNVLLLLTGYQIIPTYDHALYSYYI